MAHRWTNDEIAAALVYAREGHGYAAIAAALATDRGIDVDSQQVGRVLRRNGFVMSAERRKELRSAAAREGMRNSWQPHENPFIGKATSMRDLKARMHEAAKAARVSTAGWRW